MILHLGCGPWTYSLQGLLLTTASDLRSRKLTVETIRRFLLANPLQWWSVDNQRSHFCRRREPYPGKTKAWRHRAVGT
jgi:hypothetical protein